MFKRRLADNGMPQYPSSASWLLLDDKFVIIASNVQKNVGLFGDQFDASIAVVGLTATASASASPF